MGLEFHGDAISLSGLTGTRLKCDIIKTYYPFWWKIVSGGKSSSYERVASIVELNAATGEVYIKYTKQTVLGSAGHALELKVNHLYNEEIDTGNLKTILVEENDACYDHLKKVINRRWKNVSISEAEGPISENQSNIYLLNDEFQSALNKIDEMELGNSLFYFDPLRSVNWQDVKRVVESRMKKPFQTGTELIIFLFTSDWFLGRGDEFSALPNNLDEKQWSDGERKSVQEADALFGGTHWRNSILNTQILENKEETLVRLYKDQLCGWFRYVLPMPFNPKANQLFHLILCSNFETGVRRTKDAYTSETLNQPYKPDNAKAYGNFVNLHPETAAYLPKNRKPIAWKLLWKVIRDHEGGTCDCYCKDFRKDSFNIAILSKALEWLRLKGYLLKFGVHSDGNFPLYKINWETVSKNLGINPPRELVPLTPEQFSQTEKGKIYEVLKNWRKIVSSNLER